jgi:hypothetical protein
MPEKDQQVKTSHAAQVLTDMAEATCKVTGLHKKTETSETGSSLTKETVHKGEKDNQPTKQQTYGNYDDRLSGESQLDSHLTELASDKVDCGQFGNIEAGFFYGQ